MRLVNGVFPVAFPGNALLALDALPLASVHNGSTTAQETGAYCRRSRDGWKYGDANVQSGAVLELVSSVH